MKMLMAALTASALLAGAAAPASAETDVSALIGRYVKTTGSDKIPAVNWRRYTRQKEYIAESLPTGSGDWWRQMDREQRGGRR
jgi:hypothetical protein